MIIISIRDLNEHSRNSNVLQYATYHITISYNFLYSTFHLYQYPQLTNLKKYRYSNNISMQNTEHRCGLSKYNLLN